MTSDEPKTTLSVDRDIPDTQVFAVPSPAPVFVDSTGRRRRMLRRLAYAFGGLCMLYGGLVSVSLAGGPVSSSAVLPLPDLRGDDDKKVVQARPTPIPTPSAGASPQARFITEALRRQFTPSAAGARADAPRPPAVSPSRTPTPQPTGKSPTPGGPTTSRPVESGTTKPGTTPPTSGTPVPDPSTSAPAPEPPADVPPVPPALPQSGGTGGGTGSGGSGTGTTSGSGSGGTSSGDGAGSGGTSGTGSSGSGTTSGGTSSGGTSSGGTSSGGTSSADDPAPPADPTGSATEAAEGSA